MKTQVTSNNSDTCPLAGSQVAATFHRVQIGLAVQNRRKLPTKPAHVSNDRRYCLSAVFGSVTSFQEGGNAYRYHLTVVGKVHRLR